MKHLNRVVLFVSSLVLLPQTVLAQGNPAEIPTLVTDNFFNWIFQILSAILLGFSQIFIQDIFPT